MKKIVKIILITVCTLVSVIAIDTFIIPNTYNATIIFNLSTLQQFYIFGLQRL